MTPFEWAYIHTGNLRKKKDKIMELDSYQDICQYMEDLNPNRYSPGYWTILKNISLAYCINPFGVILDHHGIKEKIFVDLFCGAGITPIKSPESEESVWTLGSPLISTLMNNHPFSMHYFCDKNSDSLELLEKLLCEINEKWNFNINYEIIQGDANEIALKLLPLLKKKKYTMFFIDPTGFQYDWKSLEMLMSIDKFDIFFNFQTRQVKRIPKEKQMKFLGECVEDFTSHSTCDEILDSYINQLKKIGMTVTPIRIGMSPNDQYYYHLIHIARLSSYQRIPLTAKRQIEKFTGKSIKTVWNDLHGYERQKSLF